MLGRPPILGEDMVTLSLPAVNPQEDAATWQSYERSISDRPGARSSTFHHCASFSQIVNRMQHSFHSNRPMDGSRLRELATQYEHWHRSLPQVLSIDHSPPPPHILSLQ